MMRERPGPGRKPDGTGRRRLLRDVRPDQRRHQNDPFLEVQYFPRPNMRRLALVIGIYGK
jgi:hypothetical protein